MGHDRSGLYVWIRVRIRHKLRFSDRTLNSGIYSPTTQIIYFLRKAVGRRLAAGGDAIIPTGGPRSLAAGGPLRWPKLSRRWAAEKCYLGRIDRAHTLFSIYQILPEAIHRKQISEILHRCFLVNR